MAKGKSEPKKRNRAKSQAIWKVLALLGLYVLLDISRQRYS
jgi:hypothetical protein